MVFDRSDLVELLLWTDFRRSCIADVRLLEKGRNELCFVKAVDDEAYQEGA